METGRDAVWGGRWGQRLGGAVPVWWGRGALGQMVETLQVAAQPAGVVTALSNPLRHGGGGKWHVAWASPQGSKLRLEKGTGSSQRLWRQVRVQGADPPRGAAGPGRRVAPPGPELAEAPPPFFPREEGRTPTCAVSLGKPDGQQRSVWGGKMC